MLNTELIFRTNGVSKNKKNSKNGYISIQGEYFTSESLSVLVGKLNNLNPYVFIKGEIVIDLGTVIFFDKATFLVFETIVYYLCKKVSCGIRIAITVDSKHFANNVFFKSPLHMAIQDSDKCVNKKTFFELYEKQTYTPEKGFFRKYIQHKDFLKSDMYPSEIYSELPMVLLPLFDDEEWVDEVSEVVAELVCNIGSHTKGDCLVHVDNADVINDITGMPYKKLSIAILNYDENRLFDKVKNNIIDEKYVKDESPYKEVYTAYQNHKPFFNESYCEDDFFLISTFQNHVTSRSCGKTGYGTGLTTLIKKIYGKTDSYYSYVLSGDNILFFVEGSLDVSKEGFVGFNEKNDFINFPPNNELLTKSKLYVPGTIYLLTLIKE